MTPTQAKQVAKRMAKAGKIFATIAVPGQKHIRLAGTAKKMAILN